MSYAAIVQLWTCLLAVGPAAPLAGPSVPLGGDAAMTMDWHAISPAVVIREAAGSYVLSGSISRSPVGMYDDGSFYLIAGFWSSECDARSVRPSRDEVVVSSFTPRSFRLYPNSPNPFRQATRIAYDLPSGSRVLLAIYDVNGRLVKRLVDVWQDAGRYHLKWDGRDSRGRASPPGVYLCSVNTACDNATRKVLIAE